MLYKMTRQEPFRVGIVGSCPSGQGLLERLAVLPHCEIVLYEPEASSTDLITRPPGLLTTTDWRRFLSAMKLDAVLFLDGRVLDRSQVNSALDANLPVGLLPPLPVETLNWPGSGDGSFDQLRLLNPHREEADFLAVRGLLKSRPMEPCTAIKRISWVADLIETEGPPLRDDGWFSEWLWEDLDQLLVLTGELPASVYAAEFSEQRQCYSLNLRFPAGVSAQLERRRSSLVPLDLGWTVSSGYAHGRQYIRTDAGEIYDVPVDSPDRGIDPLAVFDGPGDPENAWHHAMGVLKVQAAVLESAASGQVILMSD